MKQVKEFYAFQFIDIHNPKITYFVQERCIDNKPYMFENPRTQDLDRARIISYPNEDYEAGWGAYNAVDAELNSLWKSWNGCQQPCPYKVVKIKVKHELIK